jgi:hypothetical protein
MALQRQLAAPAYLVAFALIVIPPLDALMQVIPFRLHDPRWRFGAFGLLSNAMMIPVTGLLIAFVVSTLFEHRVLQRTLGMLSLAVATATVGVLIVFGLDALQVRQQVPPAAQLAFRVASTTAVTKSILGILTLGAFGLASFKAPKSPRRDRAQRGGIMIGSSGTAAPGLRPPGGADRPADDGTVSEALGR